MSKTKGGAKTGRTRTVTVRITPALYEAAQVTASATYRTVSSLVEYALQRYIEKNFPEAFEPGARVVIRIDDAPEERT